MCRVSCVIVETAAATAAAAATATAAATTTTTAAIATTTGGTARLHLCGRYARVCSSGCSDRVGKDMDV